jgi:hypothetical protein
MNMPQTDEGSCSQTIQQGQGTNTYAHTENHARVYAGVYIPQGALRVCALQGVYDVSNTIRLCE